MSDRCSICKGTGIDGMDTGALDPQTCKECGGSGWADLVARIKELEDALPKAAEMGIKAGSVMTAMRPMAGDEISQVISAIVKEAQGSKYETENTLKGLDSEAMVRIFPRSD